MNPLAPNPSLSDDAPRMRRHRERRLLGLSCIATAHDVPGGRDDRE